MRLDWSHIGKGLSDIADVLHERKAGQIQTEGQGEAVRRAIDTGDIVQDPEASSVLLPGQDGLTVDLPGYNMTGVTDIGKGLLSTDPAVSNKALKEARREQAIRFYRRAGLNDKADELEKEALNEQLTKVNIANIKARTEGQSLTNRFNKETFDTRKLDVGSQAAINAANAYVAEKTQEMKVGQARADLAYTQLRNRGQEIQNQISELTRRRQAAVSPEAQAQLDFEIKRLQKEQTALSNKSKKYANRLVGWRVGAIQTYNDVNKEIASGNLDNAARMLMGLYNFQAPGLNDGKHAEIVRERDGHYYLAQKSPDGSITNRVVITEANLRHLNDQALAAQMDALASPDARYKADAARIASLAKASYSLTAQQRKEAMKVYDKTSTLMHDWATGAIDDPLKYKASIYEQYRFARDRNMPDIANWVASQVQPDPNLASVLASIRAYGNSKDPKERAIARKAKADLEKKYQRPYQWLLTHTLEGEMARRGSIPKRSPKKQAVSTAPAEMTPSQRIIERAKKDKRRQKAIALSRKEKADQSRIEKDRKSLARKTLNYYVSHYNEAMSVINNPNTSADTISKMYDELVTYRNMASPSGGLIKLIGIQKALERRLSELGASNAR